MTRPWYRSKRLRIPGVVLLLVLVVAVVVPFLVPADRFRPLLVRFIEGYTGRGVEIDALRLYLLPTVHLRAVNLRVKNPEGFPPSDMTVAESVDLGVAPLAFFSRKLVVTYVVVDDVRVHLLRDLAGRTNYDLAFLLGRMWRTSARVATIRQDGQRSTRLISRPWGPTLTT